MNAKNSQNMPESRPTDVPIEDHQINFRESEELKRWASELNCSLVELIAAVYMVGNSVSMVRKYLEK